MARSIATIEHLVDVAMNLFYRQGFHATGIGNIIKNAGISKMTLYNWFRSKDELILATLRKRDERWRNWFMKEVEARGTTARERLLAIPDAVNQWTSGPDFYGCMFINASAEFSDTANPIHTAAAEHKRLVYIYVRGIASFAGAEDPDLLARQVFLVMEGQIVDAQVSGTESGASYAAARKAVEGIVALGLQGNAPPQD
ncbi:MAG: TetR family transcriptional regulator [Rhodospirillales bacterium CG15_BIG_FIL_POST_REV_8_21_14_020_66_15]|nr:MAG: TetR family transcriptional regulator [Rhodospirillales bacterium CG15_BIG_FIL_POST_REV_8_21_14_020_66_15]